LQLVHFFYLIYTKLELQAIRRIFLAITISLVIFVKIKMLLIINILNFIIINNSRQLLLLNFIFMEKLILRYLLINKETSSIAKID